MAVRSTTWIFWVQRQFLDPSSYRWWLQGVNLVRQKQRQQLSRAKEENQGGTRKATDPWRYQSQQMVEGPTRRSLGWWFECGEREKGSSCWALLVGGWGTISTYSQAFGSSIPGGVEGASFCCLTSPYPRLKGKINNYTRNQSYLQNLSPSDKNIFSPQPPGR